MTNDAIQNRDELTFDEFYLLHREDIFYYVQKMSGLPNEEVQDITSDAFVILLQSWSTLTSKTQHGLLAWMRKTARFLIYNLNHKKRLLPTISLDDVSDISTQYFYMDWEICNEMLGLIKNKLNENEYRLFSEIVIKRKSFPLIAKEMNLTVNALHVRWSRLRKKIQGFL